MFSSRDSDSIACIAGAFAGAYKGLTAWPSEYRERILAMSAALAS